MNDRDDDYDRDHDHDGRKGPSHLQQARDTGRAIRLIIMAAILVALVVVALDNTDDVPLGYVVGDGSAPVWIVVVGSAIGGILLGWMFKHRPGRDN